MEKKFGNSKLQELIDKYCPNGVEYKPLWMVTYWDKKFNGVDKSKQPKVIDYKKYFLGSEQKSLISDNGDIKILTTYNSDCYADCDSITEYINEGEVVCIPWGGNAIVQYYNGRFITGDNRIAISIDTDILSNKYLYYVLDSRLDIIESFYRGSGIKHPDMNKVLHLEIPIPPMPVQEEIVRILDKFTELETELETELALRKQQYEYYRDNLLDFEMFSKENIKDLSLSSLTDVQKFVWELVQKYAPDGVEYDKIGNKNLFDISRGNVISKDYIQGHQGDYPVYSSQTENNGCLGYIDTYAQEGESITWTTDGANAGTVFYRNGRYNITNVCGLINVIDKENILTKYVSYILSASTDKYVNRGMGNPKLMSNVMATIKIPIPPKPMQEKIVEILDKFNDLTTDIQKGLPAEIEMRRKQYEYYRDKLLSFNRANGQ